MPFLTASGNIFDSGADVLVNPVNCRGAMGAGLAKAFATRWPEMLAPYREACSRRRLRPGGLHLWRSPEGTLIANLATKDHWRDPSRLEWVSLGCAALRRELAGQQPTVAVPALGCGLGGLDWAEVEATIRMELAALAAPAGCTPGGTVLLYPPR